MVVSKGEMTHLTLKYNCHSLSVHCESVQLKFYSFLGLVVEIGMQV